ncbi:MAG: cupin domain-containing protein [Elusimicrobia bacterium]|nr:cupin domain-containing protein [Elusimicrobiota bacterium]
MKRLTDSERAEKGIPDVLQDTGVWNVWECEPSKFNWHYESEEQAYLYEGRVKVRAGSQLVEIKAGDYAVFPTGLNCTWEVLQTVKKVYRFV